MSFCEGTITIVQEARFQLVDRAGVARLFVLSPHAALEPALLPLLRLVRVHHRIGTDVIAGVATRIEVLDR